jgi:predicted nucleic acid-binding protein
MPIVSNTSTILNLAIIEKLDTLRGQFEEVWIPPAVLNELRVDTDFPGAAQIRRALGEKWLRVEELSNIQVSQVLKRELDQGEAEAIALALQINTTMILMDEHEGRENAKALGLSPIGIILGVILREKRRGKLASVSDTLKDLREKAGFHIAESLYNQVLREAGEFDNVEASFSKD